MEQTAENITKYLKEVSKLESSVYEQKRCCEEARETIVLTLPPYKEPSFPQKRKLTWKPVKTGNYKKYIIPFSIATAVFAGCIGLAAYVVESVGFIIFFSILTLACAVLLTKLIFNWRDFEKRKLEAEKKYLQETKKIEIEHQQDLKDYNDRIRNYKMNYELKVAKARETYQEAEKTLQSMHQFCDQTQETLDKIYAYDVIFPKYRNMAAVFTMLEYFQTGRCTELTGPDGAYNLYESELRQNIIINKLDNIIYRLDEIKANQFLLYSEMRNVNDHLDDLSTKVKALMDSSKQIEANTALAAHFSAITAQNTTALTMIAALS